MLGLGLNLGLNRGRDRNKPLSINGALFDLDTTIEDSYDGSSQTFANLILSPADGETQIGYDFFLGADGTSGTDEPTFVGTAGSPAAYFLYDGSDRNRLQSSNTTFLNNIHRTDQTSLEMSFGIKFYIPAGFTTGDVFFCGTANSTSDEGFRIAYDIDQEEFEFRQADGTSYATTEIGSGVVLGEGWHTLVFSMQKTSGTDGTYRLKYDTEPLITGSLETFGATTGTTNDNFQISGVSGSGLFPNDWRVSSAFMGNSYISETEMVAIRNQWAARHFY